MSRAVFDICGTLYDSNTTFDFCIWRSRRWTRFLLHLLRSKLIAVLNRVSLLYFNKEAIPVRHLFIKTLKDTPKSILSQQAKEFVNTFLIERKQEAIIALLQKFQKDDIILVSATLDCIAFHIAQYFGISHFFSSTLCYDKRQICQGILEIDLLGNKHSLFEQIDFIATDNLDDFLLCQKAQESVIVTKKKNKRFWLAQNLKNSTIMEI